MPDQETRYEIEGGTEEYLRNVLSIEAATYNEPGSDKTWVEKAVFASDEHHRRAVLVR